MAEEADLKCTCFIAGMASRSGDKEKILVMLGYIAFFYPPDVAWQPQLHSGWAVSGLLALFPPTCKCPKEERTL